jgi:hypothetical protein
MIPKSMHILDCSEGAMEVARGGFSSISQGTYQGRRVAIKVVHVSITSDLNVILSVSPILPAPSHSHALASKESVDPPFTKKLGGQFADVDGRITEILSRGSRLEAPPSPKYTTTAWGNGKRRSVCNDFSVDEEWEHQRVR